MRAWLCLLVLLVSLVAACSSDRQSSGSDAPAIASNDVATDGPRVKPPVDLAPRLPGAARFSATSDGLVTEGATYESKVRSNGAFDVVPRTTVTRPGPFAAARGTALTLSTIGIARGARELDVRGTSFLAEDGSVAIRRGTILERIENEGGGIEQSWHFDRAPIGEGDLVVRVAATGERYRTSTDHGLHFDGAELGLRYGTATWVDARGVRTTIVPRFSDGAIVLTVPSSVVERSAFPAVLDPTVAAEREIDMPAAVTAAPGDQISPVVASLGPNQGYFAVWHDRRSVRPAFVGTRIGTNGSVIDSTGITIASGIASTVTTPALYRGGDGLLLVWTVYNYDQWQDPGIYVLRLDKTGKALDAAPVAVVKNTPNLQASTAAFDGTNWLISWYRYSYGVMSTYEILGVRVSAASGAVVDATPQVILTGPTSGYNPSLAFDGTNYFLQFINMSGYMAGVQLGKDLKPLAAPVVLQSSYPYGTSTAFDGTQHMIVWYEYNPTFTGYILYARRYGTAGQPLDGGNKVTLPTGNAYIGRPVVDWDGSSFVVSWLNNLSIQAARISPAGALVDATAQTLYTSTTSIYDYSPAHDSPGGVLVYREYGSLGGSLSDVNGVKVTAGAGLTGGTPFLVSAAANSESDAATAWNGSTYFTVWLDTREKDTTIWGTPIAADGTPGTAKRLFSNPDGTITYSLFSRPRIASNGSTFYVTFNAQQSGCAGPCLYRSVFGFVMDAQGVMQGKIVDLVPSGGNVQSAGLSDVAWNGSEYLVVYEEQSDGNGISGRRVKADGTTVDDKPQRISPLTPGFNENRRAPSIAFDGTQYFVAWQTTRPTANSIQVGHIFGSRVSKEGTPLDAELAICNAFLLQAGPRVAADKNNGFFVVWEDFRTSLDSADIYGGRISPQGQLLDGDKGRAISAGDGDESRPSVIAAEDGTGWIVAWRDLRSKQAYDVYGSWISAAGAVRDSKGFLFSAEAGDEETPALAAGPAGKLLLTYSRLDPQSGYGSYRLRARSVDTGKPVGQSCTMADECSSRACVDGFCCSSDCEGCGTCSATPGTCTARPAGTDSPRCNYKCKGDLACPTECAENSDCAAGATCDKASKQCVTRQICIDQRTLQDLTGKQTDCAPYTCVGDACHTSCGSVDDCASGFVCDQVGRCVPPPNSGDVAACAVSGPVSGGGRTGSGTRSGCGFAAGIAIMLAIASARRRRAR